MNTNPANDCFICLEPIEDGRPTCWVGLGFLVHRECVENDEEPESSCLTG